MRRLGRLIDQLGHSLRQCRYLLAAALLLVGAVAISAPANAETINTASSESPVLGKLNGGSFAATQSEDGTYEKIAEVTDSGNKRLAWQWHFNVAAGSSYELRVRAQATSTKQGMDHYELRASKPGVAPVLIGTITNTRMTSYTWPMPAGFDGEVTIAAVDTNQSDDPRRGNQLWIDLLVVASSGTPSEPLGAPTNLSAVATSESTIDLSWTDNATEIDGFKIERKSNGDAFQQIHQVGIQTSYADIGLTTGTTYTYRVRAYREGGVSDYSNEASATPQSGGGGGGGNPGGSTGPRTTKVIAGYFPSWGIYNARKYWVRYIPFDRITHVNYAFANIDPATQSVVIGDSFAELTNTKDPEVDNGLPAGNLHQLAHYRDVGHNGPAYEHLKIIISVGGWTWSHDFSAVASTPEGRWRFARSLKDFIDTYNLDGADIDWEYPTGDPANCGEADNTCSPDDPVNHALLLMASRAMLGPDKELSIAMPASHESIAKIMPPLVDNSRLTDGGGAPLVVMRDPANPGDELVVALAGPTTVDMLTYVHVMNYEMAAAGWVDTTRYHAPLYDYRGESGDPAPGSDLARTSGHSAIQAYRQIQENYDSFDPDNPGADATPIVGLIPPHKLTYGLPMFGRGFKSVDNGDWDGYPGLFQFTDDSVRRRTPKGTWDGGQWGNTGTYAYWDILLNHGGDAEGDDSNLHSVPAVSGDFEPYGPYVLNGDIFIGFDNKASITDKMNYVTQENLAGVMLWDFPGDASQALIDQGVGGASAAYPAKSLVHHIADKLEELAPAP